MVVQHNLQAMNANRMLNITTNGLSKTTEKLASGYRINRAADDAAGLAISEKMRKQIKGIEQASANAQDGISCVQTAEGAIAEVEDMLQRMNQLTVQAANGTNSVSDRQAIQDEIDQLVDEIDRISETSKFNETYLLKGATDGAEQTLAQYTYKEYEVLDFTWDNNALGSAAVSYYTDENCTTTLTNATTITNIMRKSDDGGMEFTTKIYAKTAGGEVYEVLRPETLADVLYKDELGVTYAEVEIAGVAATGGNPATPTIPGLPATGVRLAEGSQNTYFIETEDGTRKYITDANIEEYMKLDTNGSAVELKKPGEIKYVDKTTGNVTDVTDPATVGVIKNELPMLYDEKGTRISANGLSKILTKETARYDLYLKTGQTLEKIGVTNDTLRKYVKITEESYPDTLDILLQVGSDGTYDNKLTVAIDSMGSVNLGVDILKSTKNGIVDEDGMLATDAIDVIAAAINKVSAQRASLGAIQNRLEHTINNLDNVVENTTAAESQIRDTDMASEMVRYSNTNILAQAGQSMLAQANQANQGVLSLLQG